MGTKHLLLLFGFTALFTNARADILTIRQDLVAPNSKDIVEVTTIVTENATDRAEVVERLRKELADDLGKNPALLTNFEEVTTKSAPTPNPEIEKIAGGRPVRENVIPVDVEKALRAHSSEWFIDHSRVIFSLSRGIVNSSVSTWGLMVSQHLPFEIALASGVLTGAMSGGLQYHNAYVQKYLTSSLAEKLIKGESLRKTAKTIEPFFRWYSMEVGFVAVVQLTLTMLGHPPTGTLLYNVGNNLTTALATVGAQGLWDIAISRETNTKTLLAKTSRAKKMVRFRSDLMTLGISALAVTGMIGTLAGLDFGDTIFWGMGASGGAYLAKVLYKEWQCKRLMRTHSLPRGADALSTPPGAEPAN